MPNIRRTAPSSSSNNNNEVDPYGGGKQLRVGGGKSLRSLEDDDEEESSEEEEEEQNYSISQARGGGKQLRGHGGKYLHPPGQDDDEDEDENDALEDEDDDDDDEVEDVTAHHQPVRVIQRSGGKNLLRMAAPDDDDDDDGEEEDSDDDDEEDVVEEKKPVAYQVVPRSGGKSLTRMVPNEEDDDDDDDELEQDESEEEEAAPVRPVQRAPGGKGLLNLSRGKTLRPSEEEQPTSLITPSTLKKEPESAVAVNQVSSASRGKQLRQPEPGPVEPAMKVETSIAAPRGKQLRQPELEETEKPATKQVVKATPRGKQLRQPVAKKPEPAIKKVAAKVVASSGGRGKQLRKPIKDDEDDDDDDDDEDEMVLESDSGDDDMDEEDDEDFAEVAPRSRPKRAAAAKKTIVEDDVIGEDEISSDDDDDDEMELDINNTEALIRDETDRKHLDSLPELEREAILAERFDKMKAEQDMKKAIKEAKRKETEQATKEGKGQTGKRKAAPAKQPAKKSKSDEELAKTLAGRRESARDRDRTGAKSKKAAALAALKKEKKIQQQQQRDDSSDESDLGFDDDDDDSDEDYDDGQLKPWQKKDRAARSTVSRLDKAGDSSDDMEIDDDDEEEAVVKKKEVRAAKAASDVEAGLEDFIKVTIPRRRLARWCNEPFFNAAILECFVRLFIGEDDNGEKVYRLCEIVDVVTTNKSYKFPVAKKGDKPVATYKTLRLKFGTSERDFPMFLISDAAPEEIDVVKYVTTQKNHRLDVLTKRRANKLRRLQDDLVNNYTYTTEDIERNLEHRKQLGKTFGNLGLEQTKMSIAVQAAQEYAAEMDKRLSDAKKALMESEINADEAELTRNVREAEKLSETAQKRLEELLHEERAMKKIVENRKKKLSSRAKDMNWAKVNERAVQANQRADRESNKPGKDGAGGGAEKVAFNPYARRRVKPKILWEVGQTNDEEKKSDETKESETTTKENAASASSETLTPTLIHESQSKAAALRDRHQFAIDEESLAQATVMDTILGGSRKKAIRANRTRTGISLAEYMEKKEQGVL